MGGRRRCRGRRGVRAGRARDAHQGRHHAGRGKPDGAARATWSTTTPRPTATISIRAAQGITCCASRFATLTGVPAEKLRLHLHDVGGSFGQRSAVYPEHAAMMIAAKKLGRPVKWVSIALGRFLVRRPWPRRSKCRANLRSTATASSWRRVTNFTCDMGAYLTPGGPAGHLRNVATCMTGVYRTPALYGAFKVVLHQCHADRRISWRRPSRHRLCRRAPGRQGGGRTQDRPRRAAPAQLHPARRVSVQVDDRRGLRAIGFCRLSRQGVAGGGLGGF